ncbi:nucleosidase [Corynebacterium diphtheriae]|nr:nucleosidase [Corynebacterium diphtheriae]CAB0871898.1 nucleosidase [Corynebacterium diphtheriae]CAB0968586.1 nucleosidase [Corynebacterium diphtheriae]
MDIRNGHPLIVIAAPEEADGMPASIPTLITGIGTLNAAITLTRALADAHSRGHRPSRIINAGTAGSLIPSCSGIFEIDHVIKHDFDHETLTAITGRPFANRIDLPTVTSLPTAGLATGDTFISDTATRDRLAQQAQLCDMEGYAVVKVAREFGIPVTLIKQVSDHADESAAAKWHDAARGGAATLGECVAQIVGLS